MKNLPDHYLHFTRKERNGIIVLLAITLLIILAPRFYVFTQKESLPLSVQYAKEIAMLREMAVDSTDHFSRQGNGEFKERFFTKTSGSFPKEDLTRKLHSFDPNTIDISGWQSLGVKEKTATGIRHYIEKGGRFRKPEDINKIWGLSDEMKLRLLPYITIAERDYEKYQDRNRFPQQEKKSYGKRTIQVIDINKADTTMLIALPGIGSKLASRIINFRDRLGGFYEVNQVGETFGLPDSTFQKIRQYLNISTQLRKININTVTLEELKQHPYIRWQLANVIIQYRLQHGNFSSVEELKKIMIIKEDIYLKISPYCKIE